MAKPTPPTETLEPAPAAVDLTIELTGHISRFQAFHGLVCKSALEIKLAKYFAGLEVNALYDLHREQYGETRGRPLAEGNTESTSVISLEDFLEQHLNVTARTARKYRNHFLSVTSSAPETAERLNGTWRKLALKGDPATDDSALSITSLQAVGTLHADVMQALCAHADEWGLNELFEAPQRDVTPPSEPEPGDDSADKKAKKAAMVAFWTVGLIKRFDQDEYLRLPATQLEAVVNKMEEAAKKAREVLAAKKAKKGGKGKAA